MPDSTCVGVLSGRVDFGGTVFVTLVSTAIVGELEASSLMSRPTPCFLSLSCLVSCAQPSNTAVSVNTNWFTRDSKNPGIVAKRLPIKQRSFLVIRLCMSRYVCSATDMRSLFEMRASKRDPRNSICTLSSRRDCKSVSHFGISLYSSCSVFA